MSATAWKSPYGWKRKPPMLGIRRRVRVIPGWPQATVKFRCGHSIVRPTWHNGRTTPKPLPFYRCHECIKAWMEIHWK